MVRQRRVVGFTPAAPVVFGITTDFDIPRRRLVSCSTPALLCFVSIFMQISAALAGGAYYTASQAEAGHVVFVQKCAICHGRNLEGKSGPALAGDQFLSVSQYQNLTADYLFRFMSKHMPLNAPGSLSQTQYLNVLSYILNVNNYRPGKEALAADDEKLTSIKIEPVAGSQQSAQQSAQ
ncbi:c-type cytochrome [Rhodopila sp.]|uniref:c-type cytochrome n=1 Tax=Rhodopila sp. TaxID=2480087 RepID=UPI003D0E62B2